MIKNMKTKNPLITIIIPVFNGEIFIAEALKSIDDQKYEN